MRDLHSDSYAWFLDFARTIFYPQSAYYAESILLPLIARIIGATSSLENYKLLCGFLTICILPICAIFAQVQFKNFAKTLLFIFLFGLSFTYLRYFILGFPDPLTILLLVASVFQRRLGYLFILLTLAILSHFSMAALGIIGLMTLLYFSPVAGTKAPKKLVSTAMTAIIFGKLFLLAWYSLFHYHLVSRIDWALGKGYPFFLDRYETNISSFWLTPGVLFLALYLLILIYFLALKKIAFVLAAIFALALGYMALFCTVDGLRVFAVIIAAPFTFLLMTFITYFWRERSFS